MIGRGKGRAPAAGGGQSVANSTVHGPNIQIGGSFTGDLLILLDRPDYRLEFLTPTPAEHDHLAGRSPRQPSYLLDPQHQVVPYRPRPIEQHHIQDWLDDDTEAVSVQLVTGPGGRGKTRFASHVASACFGAGWAVAQAVERSPELRTGQSSVQVLAENQPLLVVMDYAERWRLPVLAHLVEVLPLEYPQRRVRVLLLARPVPGLWEDIAATLDRGRADLRDPLPLGELDADRVAVFIDAATAFAARLRVTVPAAPPAQTLADPGYDSPLSVHMAALAAVCATGDDQNAPARPQDSTRFLLRHERRFWIAATEAHPDAVKAGVLEQLVVVGTLLGPLPGMAATVGLLRRARLVDGDAHASGLLAVYERLYAAQRTDSCAGGGVLEEVATLQPLRPDRLGEDLVGAHLASNPHTGALLAELLAELDPSLGVDELAVRRCLIVLAAAAARHDGAATTLFTLLEQHRHLCALAPATVVRLVAERATATVAAIVEAALPSYSTELLRPAVMLAQRLYDALPATATPAQRAHRLIVLGICLSQVGDKRAALAPTEKPSPPTAGWPRPNPPHTYPTSP